MSDHARDIWVLETAAELCDCLGIPASSLGSIRSLIAAMLRVTWEKGRRAGLDDVTKILSEKENRKENT